jgi:hypothetical protein
MNKQEQGEPVAWVVYSSSENDIVWADKGKRLKQNTPLYTTPQQRTTEPKRQLPQAERAAWVGLTDIDYAGLPLEQVGLVRWAEAKLKEKNT